MPRPLRLAPPSILAPGRPSLRYVKHLLALRLNHPMPKGAEAQLSHEFRDIISSGAIRQQGALPEEADDHELLHLPRLVFHFNRKDYGRLIQLIHRINDLGAPAASGKIPSPRKSR